MEPGRGFEPPTYSLRKSCSTAVLSGLERVTGIVHPIALLQNLLRSVLAVRQLGGSAFGGNPYLNLGLPAIARLSGIPESNWRPILGKEAFYH